MTDHGAGLYDLIEISGPRDAPLPAWLTADWMPCADCRANAFLTWVEDKQVWHVTVAHDDSCPVLLAAENGGPQ